MKIFYANTLKHTWHLKLAALFDLCFPSPGLPSALPSEADGLWLAADENEELTGCLLLFRTGFHSWEGIPFVHPAYRRKGIFSALLANACQKGNCPGEDELFFSVRPGQTLWFQVLQSIEAEKAFDEYMMEYSFHNLSSACLKTEADLSDELTVSFQGTEGTASFSHVSCRLSSHGTSVYLYQLLTETAFRRQGLASAFLHRLFYRLNELGFSSVRLQVSGENLPAMALYKKTGFHITETLSFYLY